jgi:hypothetical protein
MTIPPTGSAASVVPTPAGRGEVARLLLDSTVIIDALRGRPAADRLVGLRRRGIEPWVCPISVEEIWRGLRHGEEAAVGRFFGAVRAGWGSGQAARVKVSKPAKVVSHNSPALGSATRCHSITRVPCSGS